MKHFMQICLIMFALFSFSSCSMVLQSPESQNDNDSVLINETMCISNGNGHDSTDFIKKYDIKFKAKNKNALIVKLAYIMLSKANSRPFLNLIDKDIQWTMEGVEGTIPFTGTFTGREGVEDFLKAWQESVVITNLSLRYFLIENDRMNVHLFEEGYVKATGKSYAMEVAHMWQIGTSGKITSFHGFIDCFALYSAFIPGYDPGWSMQKHEADYNLPEYSFSDSRTLIENIYFNVFLLGNVPYLLERSSDSIIWIMAGNTEGVKFAGTYFGIAGEIQFLNNMFSVITFNHMPPLTEITYVVDGSRVDVRQREWVYSYSTGRFFNSFVLHTININDEGKLASFRSYNNTYNQQSVFDWN